MKVKDEIRARYGIPDDISIETFDYFSISTSDLLNRIMELRTKLKDFSDSTLEESLEANVLGSMQSELERRIKER